MRALAVATVARGDVARERGLVDRLAARAQLDGPPPRTLAGRGGQVELYGRVREDDRPDVPSLHHDARWRGERALQPHEARAYHRAGPPPPRQPRGRGGADGA